MFTQPVFLNHDSHQSSKAFLSLILPNLRSAHRAEALARCIGFKSNAVLLSKLADLQRVQLEFCPDPFSDFLKSTRGLEVDELQPHLLFAHIAILGVMEANWNISTWGFGFGQPQRLERRFETSSESYARFQSDRAELKSVTVSEAFLRCLSMLKQIRPTKTARPGCSSYFLKHIAENMPIELPKKTVVPPHYVTNGTLIAAAVYAGFKFKSFADDYGYDHVNVNFNMYKSDVDELNYRFRPDSARADDYSRRKARRNLLVS